MANWLLLFTDFEEYVQPSASNYPSSNKPPSHLSFFCHSVASCFMARGYVY